jgi:hypothetical protein
LHSSNQKHKLCLYSGLKYRKFASPVKSEPLLPTPGISYYNSDFTIVFSVTKNIDFAFITKQNHQKLQVRQNPGRCHPPSTPEQKFTLPASPAP